MVRYLIISLFLKFSSEFKNIFENLEKSSKFILTLRLF